MNKGEITQKLIRNHDTFIQLLEDLSEKEFTYKLEGKWSAGQQAEHLVKSIRPLNGALLLPNFALKMIIGKANRPSRTYDELVAKYQSKLHLVSATPPEKYMPDIVKYSGKDKLLKQLKLQVDKLIKRLSSYSEDQLDYLILPHPLIGKITLREMMYFNIYHVEHHQKLISEYLKEYHS